jgi:hypothetical protein
MNATPGRIAAAERRAAQQLCSKCRAGSKITSQHIWELMQRVREEWEQCATPSKLIEWAEAREKDGARLRELAASRSREAGQ